MHNQNYTTTTTTKLIDEKPYTKQNNFHAENNNIKQNNILHTTITTTSTALELHDNVHLKNPHNQNQENEKHVDLTISSSSLTPNLNEKPTKVFINDGQLNPRMLEKSNNYNLPHLKLSLKNNFYNNQNINNNNNDNNNIKSKNKSTTNNGLGSYGLYRNTISLGQDDKCKLYTIYGNDNGDNEKLSELPPSATGSLSSIITTSIASSEPEPGVVRKGGGGSGPGTPHDDSKSLTGTNGADEKSALNRPGIKQEKWATILMQVSIPFFLAGIGTIGAGIVLGRVERWRVFRSVSELFILVPALLGLKGNLDMCLASRLSTQVNLGNMSSKKEMTSMIVGNIALVQVQAIVASFLVALFALVVGGIISGEFSFQNVMLLVASAMFTATSSCFVLDFVLVAVILLSQKYNLNPDNMATPLAASIGDVVSISVFSFIASILYDNLATHLWVTFIIVACYALLLPIWVVIVLKNRYTRPVLKTGWVPVLTALCISGISGLVLDAAEKIFDGFVVFQPIINGIGGNLVSVHASKISTMLHQSSILGIIPPHTKILEWPWRALFKGVPYARTARILLAMSIPGNILFIFAADYIHMSQSTIGAIFVIIYVATSFIQVMILLYIAHIIVHAMWKWKVDPDSASIPYLTALGDLFGTSMLAVAFFLLVALNQEYGDDLSQLNST